MKIQYFEDTDTLYIEFHDVEIIESRDLDEHTLIDVDSCGKICAITFEHASLRTDIHNVTVERIAA